MTIGRSSYVESADINASSQKSFAVFWVFITSAPFRGPCTSCIYFHFCPQLPMKEKEKHQIFRGWKTTARCTCFILLFFVLKGNFVSNFLVARLFSGKGRVLEIGRNELLTSHDRPFRFPALLPLWPLFISCLSPPHSPLLWKRPFPSFTCSPAPSNLPLTTSPHFC